MAVRTAKPKAPAVWQISSVAKKAIYLGQVEAADAETAIKTAIKKYDIRTRASGPPGGAPDRDG